MLQTLGKMLLSERFLPKRLALLGKLRNAQNRLEVRGLCPFLPFLCGIQTFL